MEVVNPEEIPSYQKWLTEIIEELCKKPESISELIIKVLKSAIALKKCWNFYVNWEKIQSIDKLLDILKRGKPVEHEEITSLITKAELPWNENTRAQTCELCCYPSSEMTNEANRALKNELAIDIQNSKEKLASDTVQWGAFLSAVIFTIQCIKLKHVWNRIKGAQNIDKSSLPIIQSNLEKLTKGVELLASSMTKYEEIENLNDKKVLTKDIELMISEYGDIYNKSFIMIATLKVNIDGKIQLIYADATTQKLDAVQNLAYTLEAGITLYQHYSSLTNPLRWVQGAIVAGYAALTTMNFYTHTITKKVFEDLKESMKELENLEKELQDVEAKIHAARQWLREHIKFLV